MSAGSAQDVQAIRARLHAVAERIRQRAAEGRVPRPALRVPPAARVIPAPREAPQARVHHWSDVGEDGPEDGGAG